MKYHLFLLSCLTLSTLAHGQYGNEWVYQTQEYYKITIGEEGIFRLNYADLDAAGVPVDAIDPRKFQIYRRGQELAINVVGQVDAVFNTSDYIQFYGRKNDGALDSTLYLDPSLQPHNLASLYSDSATYFLTWRLDTSTGKRMNSYTDTNVLGLPAEPYQLGEIVDIREDNYSKGETFVNYVNMTEFDKGEGFTGVNVQEGTFRDYMVSEISNQYSTGPMPNLELLLVGRNIYDHSVDVSVSLDGSSWVFVGNYNFTGYSNFRVSESINWAQISAGGDLHIRIAEVTADGVPLSRVSMSYAKIEYARDFDLQLADVAHITLANNGVGTSYISVLNTASNAELFEVTDETNVQIVGNTGGANDMQAIVRNTSQQIDLMVAAPSGFIPKIEKVKFKNINIGAEFVIISHTALMQATANSANPVKDYADYRASAAGGSYDTLVLDAVDVYNQFNYGEISPAAIHNLMRFLYDNGNPQFLFLIGESLDVAYRYHKRDRLEFTYHDLVPVAGSPGSDAPYTAGLDGGLGENAIPTGRITASTPEQVSAYLNKVIEMESTPFDALWRKNILHLSGGKEDNELLLFRSYMHGFGAVAEEDFLGGAVKTIGKETANISEFVNIGEEANNGLNLITFFGHSAPNITDIDIGFASDDDSGIDNKGKYPTILVNGCNAGSIFQNNNTFGEDWMLTENRGAINFVAHTYFGLVSGLKNYTNLFYSVGYGDSTFVDQPIGVILKEVGRKYLDLYGTSAISRTQVQQMLLQGDPAHPLFGASKPDYSLHDSDIIPTAAVGNKITTSTDSIRFELLVKNFGRTSSDVIQISAARTLPNGDVIRYDTLQVEKIFYRDTITYTISNEVINGQGTNRFEFTIDVEQAVDELDEMNNTASVDLFIPVSGTINLFPTNKSIVSDINTRLISQTADLVSDSRQVLFEIDTTHHFNSAFRQTHAISTDLIATWEPSLLPESLENDSTVYFWRTKFSNTLPGEDSAWNLHSFTFIISGTNGWMEGHPGQFDDIKAVGINFDSLSLSWGFEETSLDFSIFTHGVDNPFYDYTTVDVQIDGLPYIYDGVDDNARLCRDNSLNAIAFDKSTSSAYAALESGFRDVNTCGREFQIINNFSNTELNAGAAENFNLFTDAVGLGDMVVLFSIGEVQFSTLDATTLSKFEEFGIRGSDIVALQDGEPFIAFGKKGEAPGTAVLILADGASTTPSVEQDISFEGTAMGKYSDGKLNSARIGPATQWGIVTNNTVSLDNPVTDVVSFDIYGVENSGSKFLLLSGSQADGVDLSFVDASTFPFLEITSNMADEPNLTAPQLTNWSVTYTGVPEGILQFVSNSEGNSLALEKQEGEKVATRFAFANLAQIDFADSLQVEYSFFNSVSRVLSNGSLKIFGPAASDSTYFEISFDSKGQIGSNTLQVAVNLSGENELVYSNNSITLEDYVNVSGDALNPLVDVSFDGEYILDGDIVSPNPNIEIVLKDENPYLFKQDTTGIDIYLRAPCETCDFIRVSFSDPTIAWSPANENVDFHISLSPVGLEDGVHSLRVKASDASGNSIGSRPYEIGFQVINASTVTNFYPYPNPFSTSTQFVFTLTGNELPEEIKIQIMTIRGKVVREIFQDELGPLRIGNNRTDFAWNGRDEFGDQLANGIYLYKVTVRNNGEVIDLRESSGDRGFSKGYGKLYLLR